MTETSSAHSRTARSANSWDRSSISSRPQESRLENHRFSTISDSAKAGELHLSRSLIYQWGNPAEKGRNDPLTQLAKVMLKARENGSTDHLAPLYFLMDVFLSPGNGPATKMELDLRLLQLHREAGELDAAHLDALQDGELDSDEAERMRREAQDVLGKVYAYTMALDRLEAGEGLARRTADADEAA